MNTDQLTAMLGALFTWKLALVIGLGQAAQVVASWIASRLLAPQHASVFAALRWYASLLATVLASLLALFIVASIAAAAHFGGVGLVVGAWFLFLLYASVSIPMKIYEVGVGRAIGMLAIVWVASSVLSAAASFVVGPPVSQADLTRAMATLQRAQLPAALPAAVATSTATPGEPPPAPKMISISPSAAPAKGDKTVTLRRALTVPVSLNGQDQGEMTLDKGEKLRLLGTENGQWKVQYLSFTALIPKDAATP